MLLRRGGMLVYVHLCLAAHSLCPCMWSNTFRSSGLMSLSHSYVSFFVAIYFCWYLTFRLLRSFQALHFKVFSCACWISSHIREPKVPVSSAMTYEYKLLKSSVFNWKLPVMSEQVERESEWKKRTDGRSFILIALLQVSASYSYIRDYQGAVAVPKHHTQQANSTQGNQWGVCLCTLHKIHIF